jgi:hypothetical protein
MSSRLPFRMSKQPGQDLLPLSNKGVFVGLPPAQHPFSPILLSIQALEPCCRDRGHSTPQEVYPLYNRPRKELGTGEKGWVKSLENNHREAEHGLLQLLELV